MLNSSHNFVSYLLVAISQHKHLEPILIHYYKNRYYISVLVLTYIPHDYVKVVEGYVVNKEFRKRLEGNNTSGACAVISNNLNFNKTLNLWITLFVTPQSVRPLCSSFTSCSPTHLIQCEISCRLLLSRKLRSIFRPSTVSSTLARTWHGTQLDPSRQDINLKVLASSCDVSETSVAV